MAQQFIATPGGNIYPDKNTDYNQAESFRRVALNRDGKDSDLRAEAEAAAASKADAALLSAKADATAKADSALASAKADATTKANAAEANAIADATTKYGGLPARVTATEAKNAAQDVILGAHQALLDTAVFDFDNRLFEVADTESKDTFTIVDRHDRLVQSSRIPEGDAETESGESVAVIDRHDRAIFTPEDAGGDASATPYPSFDWAHWGDSLTGTDYSGIPGAWVTQLATLTGRNHFNGGWSGQTTDQVAARQGGLPAMVKLPGDLIPATGPVTVVTVSPSPVRQAASKYTLGTLCGVHGKVQEKVSGIITFTRTLDGAAVACPPGSLFVPDDASAYADRIATLGAGRNDVYLTAPEIIVSHFRAMIDYLASRVKRVMVLEIPPSETSPASHGLLVAINSALKAAFPEHWVPYASWLRTEAAATAAGITFTADDQADIAAGITPRSFRVDTVHFNATGCTAIAKFVYAEAQRRIWL